MQDVEELPNDGICGARRAVSPRITAVGRAILVLGLLLPAPLLAADFNCAQSVDPNASAPRGKLAELEEVVVSGRKPRSHARDLSAWLKRLEGQYSFEGYIDLCGNGNPADERPITGKADCAGLYVEGGEKGPRNLYCVIDGRWPFAHGDDDAQPGELESRLSPAVVVYGVVPDLPGIDFMQIDNKGIATRARGRLVDHTLTATGSCGRQDHCQKVTRITVDSDGKSIAMLVEIRIDARRVMHQSLLLRRVSNIRTSRKRWSNIAYGVGRAYDRSLQVDLESVGKR